MHHTMAQVTAHETVLSGGVACSTAYGVATTIQKAKEWESTLFGLCKEANKAWKDANDIIFSHLLKYDSEVATFITSTEDTLRNKHEEIWKYVHSLADTGIPMMFTYGPELYELWSWGMQEMGIFTSTAMPRLPTYYPISWHTCIVEQVLMHPAPTE